MTQIHTRLFLPSMYERPVTNGGQFSKSPNAYRGPGRSNEYPSPYLSDRQDERSEQKPSESRSLNSNDNRRGLYEPLPLNPVEMYQTTSDRTKHPSREQLPPLSSLFGTVSHPTRSVQSPYSDRNSPVFPATSPRDARHPTTPAHGDRPYEGAYFQRPSTAQQSSYNPKLEKIERVALPPSLHPGHSTSKPESPRYEAHYAFSEAPRTHLPASPMNSWSPQQHPRPEYFSRDTSSSFRPHSEQRPPPPPPLHRAEQDSRPLYRIGQAPITPTYPPTPASTIVGDTTIKDGLGPKIWTGTQFLPRFVRQAEVQGEGMCYFYDDGTHCKTVIDGEIVNAHWGVTKAGKPRKRLAIACITCREKKIKCDPDFPRCVQCEKFGRVCKFKNAPRGGQGSPDTPPADPEDLVSRPESSRTEGEAFKVETREGSHSASPRQRDNMDFPDGESPLKRQRTSYTVEDSEFTPVASEASPRPTALEPTSPSTHPVEETRITLLDTLLRDWNTNPFTTDPVLANELLSIFFKHISDTTYRMFPKAPFQSWLESSDPKSLDDLMLIYTILAFGTVFSGKKKHVACRPQYVAISEYACAIRPHSLQLVQSSLIFALYHAADGNNNDSERFCALASTAAIHLKLNLELENSGEADRTTFPYGLNQAGYAECRRRTFWSCYLMDRINGFCSGHPGFTQSDDVFLRLPCDTKSFEVQTDLQNPPTPFHSSDLSLHRPPNIGSMAYLIQICTIWGNVIASLYRSSQQFKLSEPARGDLSSPESIDGILQRLRAWKHSLPQYYEISLNNTLKAANTGELGTYMAMHAVFHSTGMILHRYIRYLIPNMPQTNLDSHICAAKLHAEDILTMTNTLDEYFLSRNPNTHGNRRVEHEPEAYSPFLAYAILSSIDILTAKATRRTIAHHIGSFTKAREFLHKARHVWKNVASPTHLVYQRVRFLRVLPSEFSDPTVGRYNSDGIFEMKERLETLFPRDYDCIYA